MRRAAVLTALLAAIPVDAASRRSRRVPEGYLRDRTIQVGTLERSYDLFVPKGLPEGSKAPLVISLHGHSGSKEYNSGISGKPSPHRVFLDIARREKFFVAYPQGEIGPDEKRGWNDCRVNAKTNPSVDDEAFLAALIDRLVAERPVDPDRIYVVGTSNGGGMAYRMGVAVPRKLAGIASIIFTSPAEAECPPPREPLSYLLMAGTDDPLIPFRGGSVGKGRWKRGTVRSAAKTIELWRKANGLLKTEPEVVRFPDRDKEDGSSVVASFYRGGIGGTEVAYFRVVGGGHIEPSPTERMGPLYRRLVGRQNRDIEAAEEIWKFLRGKRRVPAAPAR